MDFAHSPTSRKSPYMRLPRFKTLWRTLTLIALTAITAGFLLSGGTARAGSVTATVTGGQGNYRSVNERSSSSLSAHIVGRATVGSKVSLTCRVQGDAVENDSRWIWSDSGSFYIANAFLKGNTDNLPTCTS